MTALRILAVVILAAGFLGYLVALVLVWRFWLWMGDRGTGWPRILFRALMLVMHALAVLYAFSLVANMGVPVNRTFALVFNFVVAIILSAIPWIFIASLWRWWYPSAEIPPLGVTPRRKE